MQQYRDRPSRQPAKSHLLGAGCTIYRRFFCPQNDVSLGSALGPVWRRRQGCFGRRRGAHRGSMLLVVCAVRPVRAKVEIQQDAVCHVVAAPHHEPRSPRDGLPDVLGVRPATLCAPRCRHVHNNGLRPTNVDEVFECNCSGMGQRSEIHALRASTRATHRFKYDRNT